MSDTIPKHTYETTEGTKPTTYGKHEPRTVAHTISTGDDVDLAMMTEIGDGVFVQWMNCRRCNGRVGECRCAEGPQEPHYMKPWRDKRFARDLNTRPDPAYDMLDSVIAWVEAHGYKVTRKREPKVVEPTVFEQVTGEQPREPDMESDLVVGVGQDADDVFYPSLRDDEEETEAEYVPTEQIDAGLDAALEKVRAARDTSEIDAGF